MIGRLTGNPRNPLPSHWTDAHVRMNRKGELQVAVNPAKLGTGARFAACVRSVASKGSAYDPKAVCAAQGRAKYGKARFQRMAAAGKRRARRRNAAVTGVEGPLFKFSAQGEGKYWLYRYPGQGYSWVNREGVQVSVTGRKYFRTEQSARRAMEAAMEMGPPVRRRA